VTFTWFDPPFRPEPPHANQAYGICFTEAGMIVLGACGADGGRYWNLLGGGVEPGETLEACLVREVMEEGCARVVESRYIGCQRLVRPEDFLRTLSLGSAPSAAIILEEGLKVEARRRQCLRHDGCGGDPHLIMPPGGAGWLSRCSSELQIIPYRAASAIGDPLGASRLAARR
jgi:hypothetical protein